MIHCYTEYINDDVMDRSIVEIIDKYQDINRDKTTIKAGMTGWYMQKHPGFDKLSDYVIKLSMVATYSKYKVTFNPYIHNMWGAKYVSGEYTIPHHHFPSLWSCVYYIHPPKNSPNLILIDENNEESEIEIRHGLLIMFESSVMHKVNPKTFEGARYIASANINHHFTRDINDRI